MIVILDNELLRRSSKFTIILSKPIIKIEGKLILSEKDSKCRDFKYSDFW